MPPTHHLPPPGPEAPLHREPPGPVHPKAHAEAEVPAQEEDSRLLLGQGRVYECRKCRYELTGLGVSGACPECGNSFDIAHNQGVRVQGKVESGDIDAMWLRARTIALSLAAAGVIALAVVIAALTDAWARSVSTGGFIALAFGFAAMYSLLDEKRFREET